MDFKEGDQLEVKIYDVSNAGNPLAHPVKDPDYDGSHIHVPGAKEGDTVLVEVVDLNSGYVVAKPTEHLKSVRKGKQEDIIDEQEHNKRHTIRLSRDYGHQWSERMKEIRRGLRELRD